jgi:hypothetical protein
MKLEDQVVSLELAKKLRELGFEQESLFYWHFDEIVRREFMPTDQNLKVSTDGHNFSAYTVAELGGMLPQNFSYEGKQCNWISYLAMNGWNVQYESIDDDGLLFEVVANKEADARAKMLIYLKENKFI